MVDRPLSYAIVSKMVGNPPTMIGFVVAKCGSCGTVEEVQWRQHHNPHHISNYFKQHLNWEFDAYRESKCRCPHCQSARSHLRTEGDRDRLVNLDTFGARFRWTREQAHLKRDEIAQETGINSELLEFLESGRQSIFNLDPSSTNKLIDVLRDKGAAVERDWLLGTSQQSQQLAKNLKREIERQSFTEGALADRAHCSISAVKQILSGTIPTHYKLPDIAKVLRTTPEKLMGVPEPIIALAPPAKAGIVIEPAVLPTPEPAQPVIIIKPIVVPDDATIGQRLRAARLAKELSQARLANAIYERTDQWTIQTLIWMISQVEHHDKDVSGRVILIGIIGQILSVRPEWLLGRTNEPQFVQISRVVESSSVAPPPATSDLQPAPETSEPPVVAPPLPPEEADEIRRQLETAESSMVELKTMIEDRLNDITALRDLVDETRETVDDLRTRFTESTSQLVLVNQNAPVDITPIALEPIMTNDHGHDATPVEAATNGHGNGHVDEQHTPSWSGTIDRTAETKQNHFARALRRNVRNKYLTMEVIFTKMRDVIDELKPPECNNENLYVHAMMRREVIARNGLLEKVGRGVWQYREGAHI